MVFVFPHFYFTFVGNGHKDGCFKGIIMLVQKNIYVKVLVKISIERN